MAQFLTGIADTDFQILLNLDPISLFNLCQTNQYAQRLCQNENFWIQKIIHDFGREVLSLKPPDESFKEQYRSIIYTSPEQAAAEGRLDIVIVEPIDDLLMIIEYAAMNGQINILEWALDQQNVDRNNLLKFIERYAASCGQVNVLDWLKNNNFQLDDGIYNLAALKGHLNVFEWMWNNTNLQPNPLASANAALRGHTNILQWLFEHNLPIHPNVVREAVINDQANVLDWLVQHEFQIHPNVVREAVINDQANVLDWLEQHGFQIDPDLVNVAVQNNKYSVVNWFAQRGIYPKILGKLPNIEIPDEFRRRERLPETVEEARLMLPYFTPRRSVDRAFYYTLPELRQIVRNLGLNFRGNKAALAQQLRDYLTQ
jgi:hypothetical protein